MGTKYPPRVRLTLDTWLLILGVSAALILGGERLASRDRARMMQQLQESLERRLGHNQQEERRAIGRLDRQINQARAQADAAVKDTADFRSEVARVSGQLDAQKSKNAQRLRRIEAQVSEAKKTGEQTKAVVEHVDETVQKVAPEAKPWWKRW